MKTIEEQFFAHGRKQRTMEASGMTHMLEWLAAAVDFIASIFLAETQTWV